MTLSVKSFLENRKVREFSVVAGIGLGAAGIVGLFEPKSVCSIGTSTETTLALYLSLAMIAYGALPTVKAYLAKKRIARQEKAQSI